MDNVLFRDNIILKSYIPIEAETTNDMKSMVYTGSRYASAKKCLRRKSTAVHMHMFTYIEAIGGIDVPRCVMVRSLYVLRVVRLFWAVD